jgi:hypothetical protein
MPPNVLLIVLDTARADALEPYGASAGSSPAVADLARAGHVLNEARATSCWTLPSHASMFTGALPRGLGLGQAPASTPQSAAPVVKAQSDRMLPEVLNRAGYDTRAVSTNLWVSSLSGFDTGFERFEEIDGSRQMGLEGGRRARAKWTLEAMWGRADDGASESREVVSDWIAESPSQPFFWFVNLVECHSPYLPPRPYHGVPMVERLRAAEEARRHLNLGAIWRACAGEFDVPEDALDRMRRLYASCVRYADDWLEAVLTELQRSGLLDDTLVIVCSDHGENFGEGELIAHACSLDDRLIRVPLIVAGPGADAFNGMRSLAEVPARIARAVELTDHPWRNGGPPTDVSIAQWDAPASASDPRIQEAVAEWGLGHDTAERLGTDLTCVTSGRWKLVLRAGEEELLDLETDPLEVRPIRDPDAIASTAGEELEPLRAALNNPAVMASVHHDAPSASPEELEEIEDRMKLLGYM